MQIGYLNYVKSSSDELHHHGIKGQSWGVKNGPPYPLNQKKHNGVLSNVGSSLKKRHDQKKIEKREKKEQKKSERIEKKIQKENLKRERSKKSVKRLTDAELNEKINRLQKEKQYQQLLKDTQESGKKKTDSILGQIGKTTVKSVGTSVAIFAGKKLVSSFLKSDEDRARMFGKQWVDPLGANEKTKEKGKSAVEKVIADVVTETNNQKKKKVGTTLAAI